MIDVMKITHAETKTKAIILALEALIQKFEISKLKKFKGKIHLEIDLDVTRDR